LAQDTHNRYGASETKPRIVSRYQSCNVGSAIQNRNEIAVEVGRPVADWLLVCVTNDLDDVDIEFLDVLEDFSDGFVYQLIREPRRQLRASDFKGIAACLAQ
jgi:hypothetical protein